MVSDVYAHFWYHPNLNNKSLSFFLPKFMRNARESFFMDKNHDLATVDIILKLAKLHVCVAACVKSSLNLTINKSDVKSVCVRQHK